MALKRRRISKKLFDQVLRGGNVLHSPHFTFRFLKNEENCYTIGVVASKKVARKAVGRNKLKRRGYEATYRLQDQIKSSFIGILFVKKGLDEIPFQDVVVELETVLKKANLISY
jgi:ribonuclease P protein component